MSNEEQTRKLIRDELRVVASELIELLDLTTDPEPTIVELEQSADPIDRLLAKACRYIQTERARKAQ